jgi:hypothetical protein
VSDEVDAVAERRLHGAMIDCKGRYLNSPFSYATPSSTSLATTTAPLGGPFLIHIAPHVDIELVGLLDVRHHFLGSLGPPTLEAGRSVLDPTSQPQVRDSDHVIGIR